MQPFQRLLLTTLAVSVAVPLGAIAAESDLNRYAPISNDQVTNISQLGDVQPTDWAYQALNNLVEQYGCVAGYPNGTFKGAKPLSRYEAAALLNSCLDRVTEATDELKRLAQEFERELTLINGKITGLEKKIGKLEAMQFSTTTKLQGEITFDTGAVSFGGTQITPANNPLRGTWQTAANLANYQNQFGAGSATTNNNASTNATRYGNNNNRNWGALTFNYDARLNLNTSFTGKDLLYTRLRSGNFTNSVFNGNPFNLLALDKAFAPTGGNNVFNLDRLYYRFPIGTSTFTGLVGARARNTEFLAVAPSFYKADLLDVFTLHGAPATYNKATGSTFGLMWKQKVKKGKPYLAASTTYVAENGDNSNPTQGGLFTAASAGSFTTQVGYAGPQFALAAAWRYGQCNQNLTRRGTQFARQPLPCDDSGFGAGVFNPGWSGGNAFSNNFALTAAWQPQNSGWVPSVSAGYGLSYVNHPSYNGYTDATGAGSFATNTATSLAGNNGGPRPNYGSVQNIAQLQSWQIGLQWADVLTKGNSAGFAFGQPTYVSALSQNGIRRAYSPARGRGAGFTPTRYNGFYESPSGANDGNYAFEWWYQFKVSNNISVTPALFYLSRPNGQYTAPGYTNNAFGGLVQTQFKF